MVDSRPSVIGPVLPGWHWHLNLSARLPGVHRASALAPLWMIAVIQLSNKWYREVGKILSKAQCTTSCTSINRSASTRIGE